MRLRIIVKTSHNNPEGHHEGDKYDTFLIYCENSQLYDLLTNSNGYSRSTIVGVEVIKGDGCEVMESQSQPPQPAPVPKLVDACEITLAYVRNMDTEAVFESFHAMELALAAEKRRQKLVDELIRVAKTHYHKADNLDRAIQALDAFDKERGV